MRETRHWIAGAALALLLSALGATIARAEWQPGYGGGGFAGGNPYCAVEFQGRLAVGGSFTSAGCATTPGVVFTDYTRYFDSGRRLWNPQTSNGTVETLVVWRDHLIAGGSFDGSYAIRGVSNVARFTGTDWLALGSESGIGSLYGGKVDELAVYQGDLVAVGEFTHSIVGEPLGGLARWDGERWSPMGSRPPGARALEVWNGELYCGLAKWDGANWVQLGVMEPSNAQVTATDAVDEGLAFGGTFGSIDGMSIKSTAIFDGQELRRFGDGAEFTITPYYPYGSFDLVPVSGFCSFDGETYMLGQVFKAYLGSWAVSRLTPTSNGGEGWRPVDEIGWTPTWIRGGAMLNLGDRMLVLAADERIGFDVAGHSLLRALVLEGDTWGSIVPGRGLDKPPLAIHAAAGVTWVAAGEGGLLASAQSGYNRIGWDLATGLGESGSGVVAVGTVDTSTEHLELEYHYIRRVGPDGEGLNSGSLDGQHFAPIDELSLVVPWRNGYLVPYVSSMFPDWMVLSFAEEQEVGFIEHSLALVPVQAVSDLIVHKDEVWLAGDSQVFRLSESEDGFLSSTLVGTFNGEVSSLLSDGDQVLAGGSFESVNTEPARGIAVWDGSRWHERLRVQGAVSAMARDQEGVVYAAGDFQSAGGQATSNLVVFRADDIGVFPDGPNGPVEHLALTETGFVVSGPFDQVGGYCAKSIAEWVGQGASVSLTDPGQTGNQPPRIADLRLLAPSPNPFNPRVNIAFEIPRDSRVELAVYDLAGRLVKTLASGHREAGEHLLTWDGTDAAGSPVASGVYLASLRSDGRMVNQKMALVR